MKDIVFYGSILIILYIIVVWVINKYFNTINLNFLFTLTDCVTGVICGFIVTGLSTLLMNYFKTTILFYSVPIISLIFILTYKKWSFSLDYMTALSPISKSIKRIVVLSSSLNIIITVYTVISVLVS